MKWIKLAAIIGFVFVGILLLSLILGFMRVNPIPNIPSLFVFIVYFLFLVAFFFFMYGFVKTGQSTGHKLLRVSSWMTLGVVFVLILLSLFLGLLNKPQTADFSGGLGQEDLNSMFNDSNTNFNYNGNSILTGNAIGSLFSGETMFGLVLGMIFLIFLFVSVHLFLVSIAEHRDKIKFSRSSAFFGFFIFSSYIFLLVFAVFFLFSNNSFIEWIGLLPYFIGLLALVFLSLFLLDASKKFEGFEDVTPPQEYREYSPYPPGAKARAMAV